MTTSAKPALSFSSPTAASELGPITNWSTEVHNAQLKSMNFLTPCECEERHKRASAQQRIIDARRRNRNLRRLKRLKAKEAEYRKQLDHEVTQPSHQIKSFVSKAELARDNILDITELEPKRSKSHSHKISPITPIPALPVKSQFLSYQGTNQ